MQEQLEMFFIRKNGKTARAYKANKLSQQGNGGLAVEFDKEPVADFTDEWNGLRAQDVTDSMIFLPNGMP